MGDKKRILVVDDDEAICLSAKAVLEGEGYRVDTAETGQAAIEKSRNQLYDLALLDIKLPDMEGTELLTKLRRTTSRMRKVMLTGYPTLENAIESLNLGADAYLEKPIDPRKLLRIVTEKLRERDVERITIDVIEMTLDDILGTHATSVIYGYLENDCSLRKEEIPVRMDEFKGQLRKLLGKRVGGTVIGKIDQNLEAAYLEESIRAELIKEQKMVRSQTKDLGS